MTGLAERRSLHPEDASTVVLVRPGPARPEVLLLTRNPKSSFMGGALVFPGGKTDPEDRGPGLAARTDFSSDALASQEASPGRGWSASERRGAVITAIRELFEEAGVLLARPEGRGEMIFTSHEEGFRFQFYRTGLQSGRVSLEDVVALENLRLAGEQLVYLAHWITPSAERRRFDARFFLAVMPGGQSAACDERETVASVWMTPSAALEADRLGEVTLPPPTRRVLQHLEPAGTVDEMLDRVRGRAVAPLLPRIEVGAEGPLVHLPWSPTYEELEGEGCIVPVDAPDRGYDGVIRMGGSVESPSCPAEALGVLRFWFGSDLERTTAPPAIAARWGGERADFAAEVDQAWAQLREDAGSGALDAWSETPAGGLALVLLLDQGSRKLFPGSSKAFEFDARAVRIAESAVVRGHDRRLSPMLRAFLYRPWRHAEDLCRQKAARLAFERLALAYPEHEPELEATLRSLLTIQRFGRFPERNRALGRASTALERAWLESNGKNRL